MRGGREIDYQSINYTSITLSLKNKAPTPGCIKAKRLILSSGDFRFVVLPFLKVIPP